MTAALESTRRLAELSSEVPELSAAIRAMRTERVEDVQLDALAQRLAPQLTGVALPVTSAALTLGAWTKGLLGLTLVGLGVYWAGQRTQPERQRPAAAPAEETSVATPPVEPQKVAHDRPALSTASENDQPAAPTPTVRGLRPRAASVRTEPEEQPARTPEAELALLERARAELDHAPSATLALVEQHARSYERGLFTQEREVLAIEALLKLKRRSAARARAVAFVQTFPDSAHVRRVRGLLELVPAPPLKE